MAAEPEIDILRELLGDLLPAEDGLRHAGPPPAFSVRKHGDETLSAALADALAHTGRVERATHGFHTYPAGMHPDAARAVIAANPGPVHDPFCGGGTVLVEAILAGRAASGTDLSPIALLVARARTGDAAQASALRSAARRIAEAARQRTEVEIPEAVAEWYEPHVAAEMARLRDGVNASDPAVRPLLKAVFSSIVVKASYRESDTSNRRAPGHRPPGTTPVLFHKKARELGRMLESLPAHAPARLRAADARHVGPPPGTGLVLTSPPYPGVYDYLPMQQLRLAWLGISAGAAAYASEVGSRRAFRAAGRAAAFRQWRADTFAWVKSQADALSSGGRVAINVGDGLVGDRLVDALSPTVEAMRAAGLRILARASADRPDHARNAIRIEHIVLGEKP